MSRIRRAGARWRVLVHEMLPRGFSGNSHHFGTKSALGRDTEDRTVECADGTFHMRHTVLDGYDLDEVVVGQFLHLEQKDVGQYWLNIAGVTIWIQADRDGRPLEVDVFGPTDYDDPVNGCKYSLTWSSDSPSKK